MDEAMDLHCTSHQTSKVSELWPDRSYVFWPSIAHFFLHNLQPHIEIWSYQQVNRHTIFSSTNAFWEGPEVEVMENSINGTVLNKRN